MASIYLRSITEQRQLDGVARSQRKTDAEGVPTFRHSASDKGQHACMIIHANIGKAKTSTQK